uniref:Uncharacterized protein n=1 Tax=Tetraselmis sp. GSL018 TaxID=582737 RepID=A0A061RG77_9CHLO
MTVPLGFMTAQTPSGGLPIRKHSARAHFWDFKTGNVGNGPSEPYETFSSWKTCQGLGPIILLQRLQPRPTDPSIRSRHLQTTVPAACIGYAGICTCRFGLCHTLCECNPHLCQNLRRSSTLRPAEAMSGQALT